MNNKNLDLIIEHLETKNLRDLKDIIYNELNEKAYDKIEELTDQFYPKLFSEIKEGCKLSEKQKDKKEEVAKAIDKDDPDMDMSKKMAIATSVAKKDK